MMWFFAILVVLLLGAVAVVAAGRGAPLAPVYDDRPDALVPADGDISASDLRRVRFSLAFRGYRMSEVDALLDRLAAEKEEAGAAEGAAPEAVDGSDAASGDRHTD
jgi:DivIVA domain-containing protein